MPLNCHTHYPSIITVRDLLISWSGSAQKTVDGMRVCLREAGTRASGGPLSKGCCPWTGVDLARRIVLVAAPPKHTRRMRQSMPNCTRGASVFCARSSLGQAAAHFPRAAVHGRGSILPDDSCLAHTVRSESLPHIDVCARVHALLQLLLRYLWMARGRH